MTRNLIFLLLVSLIWGTSLAQRSKVQAAWRALNDYEETLKEGKSDYSYLKKAKDAIDLALANEESKKLTRAHAFSLRINYAHFQYQLSDEMKKLEASVQDKNERALQAYGNTELTNFEAAVEELNKIRDLDPNYLDGLTEAISKGGSGLEEDDLKLAMAIQQMKIESANIASGKYKAKKYDLAADYFYKTAIMNTVLHKTKDTVSFYNACVAAAKSGNTEKILEYNKKMIDAKIGSPYNYESVYNAQINKNDSLAALETLRKGRIAFPEDVALLTQETNMFLARGKHKDALVNLKLAVEKDPSNALYFFIIGNLYDNLANPKDKTSGKEIEKPVNFEEYFKNAEENYLKAIELKPANKDYFYNALYNLGAMYNNYGGYIANRKAEKITDLARYQKENEAKAQQYYKKAIPFLEQALGIKTDDRVTMSALRKLYLLTGNEAKGKEMNEKLKQ